MPSNLFALMHRESNKTLCSCHVENSKHIKRTNDERKPKRTNRLKNTKKINYYKILYLNLLDSDRETHRRELCKMHIYFFFLFLTFAFAFALAQIMIIQITILLNCAAHRYRKSKLVCFWFRWKGFDFVSYHNSVCFTLSRELRDNSALFLLSSHKLEKSV